MTQSHDPLLTVIIPTLNESGWIDKPINDLNRQTDPNFQVILVDAQSTDNTVAQVKNTASKTLNITYINSRERNASYQRNLGATKATTPWLMFCDADTSLPPYFIQGIKYRITQDQAQVFTTEINPDSTKKKDLAIIKIINSYIKMQQNTTHPFCLEGMLIIKKDIFIKAGKFDPKISVGEGQALLKKIISGSTKYKVYKDPKFVFSLRRIHSNGLVNSARAVTELELKRLLNIPVSREKQSKLYPMHHQRHHKAKEDSKIRSLIQKLLTGDYS